MKVLSTKLASYIDQAKKIPTEVCGGNYDKSVISLNNVVTSKIYHNGNGTFGPVMTIYVYEDKWSETLKLVDETSRVCLNRCDFRIVTLLKKQQLRYKCLGNFYINDKPTGAVVGMQPFVGARASGTSSESWFGIELTLGFAENN
jgi:1-pyrroline-5-carboxylate dehydrogenase